MFFILNFTFCNCCVILIHHLFGGDLYIMKNEELIEILKKYNNSKQYIISPIDYSYIFTKDELKKLNDIYIYNQKNGISRDSIINNFMKSYIKEISYICDKIIKDSPITRNEEYIFESFVASKFLNNLNLDIYNSVINRYVNKYLSRKNSEYNNRKLVILMYYLF